MPLHIDLKYAQLISPYCEKFTRKKDYLFNFRCPFCGDSETHKNKMRGYIYRHKKNQQQLCYKCHKCNISMWLGGLVEHFSPQLYKEYLLETFKDSDASRTKRPSDEPGFFDKKITATQSIRFGTIEQSSYQHAEKISDLPEQHYCRQYVAGRWIPTEYWSKLLFTSNFKAFVEEIAPEEAKPLRDEPRLVIPFFDTFGALYAVSGRALDDSPQRYLTIRTTPGDEKLVYGLERVNQNERVYVVEGPLDSLFLPNAVASGDANLILTAKRLTAANITLVYDNERRSREIVRQMEKAIKAGYSIVIWPDWVKEKDINAMVMAGHMPYTIQCIIEKTTYSGLAALVELAKWKRVSNHKGVLV